MTVTTEEAWTRFRSKLLAYVRARSRSREDAEDILQDVFVKVHRRIATLEDDTSLGSWLYRTTHNAIIDHYRKKQPIPSPVELAEPPRGDSPTAEQTLAPFLTELVADLPDIYREALTLTELEGLTQTEMARRLGLSTSGAKSRVQRGRAMVRDQLQRCCHVELDMRGHVIDYEHRPTVRWPEGCACTASEHDRPETEWAASASMGDFGWTASHDESNRDHRGGRKP